MADLQPTRPARGPACAPMCPRASSPPSPPLPGRRHIGNRCTAHHASHDPTEQHHRRGRLAPRRAPRLLLILRPSRGRPGGPGRGRAKHLEHQRHRASSSFGHLDGHPAGGRHSGAAVCGPAQRHCRASQDRAAGVGDRDVDQWSGLVASGGQLNAARALQALLGLPLAPQPPAQTHCEFEGLADSGRATLAIIATGAHQPSSTRHAPTHALCPSSLNCRHDGPQPRHRGRVLTARHLGPAHAGVAAGMQRQVRPSQGGCRGGLWRRAVSRLDACQRAFRPVPRTGAWARAGAPAFCTRRRGSCKWTEGGGSRTGNCLVMDDCSEATAAFALPGSTIGERLAHGAPPPPRPPPPRPSRPPRPPRPTSTKPSTAATSHAQTATPATPASSSAAAAAAAAFGPARTAASSHHSPLAAPPGAAPTCSPLDAGAQAAGATAEEAAAAARLNLMASLLLLGRLRVCVGCCPDACCPLAHPCLLRGYLSLIVQRTVCMAERGGGGAADMVWRELSV